jgi:hypothetical protein
MKLIRRNPRRLLPAFLVAFALSACGSSSTAPAVDAKLLQERMDAFVTTLTDDTADGELMAKAEGKAKVETQGDGTVVGTLPRLTFTSKSGETAVLDPVVVRFSNGGDGLIKLDAKLPSSLAIRNKEGKVEGEIKIGSQSLTGIWAEKLQTLSNVDMRMSDLTIKADAGTATTSIDQIAITGGMEGKGSGLYDGRYDMTLTGLKVDDPKEKMSVKLGSLSVVSAMKGTKMEEWAKAAKEAGYTLANAEQITAWMGGQANPKVIAFLKRMPEFMGDVTYTYSISGMEIAENGKTRFGLKNSSLGFGAAGDGKGTTKISMSLSLGGIATGDEEALLPPEADIQTAVVEIDTSGVPGRQLWDIYVDALPALQAEAAKAAGETATGSADAATAGSAAIEQVSSEMSAKFMQVLTAAKLSIAMNQLNVTTPTAKIAGKGAMSYLPAESLMPEGKVSFRFTGIDALAAAMQKRGGQDETAQQIMGFASAVRAMGRPDPTSSASDRAYIIDLVFSKDGSMTANGQKVF